MPSFRENKKKNQFIADGDRGAGDGDDAYDDDLVLNNFKLFYFQFLYSFINNKIDKKKLL